VTGGKCNNRTVKSSYQYTSLYAFAIASSWPGVVLPNDGAAAEHSTPDSDTPD